MAAPRSIIIDVGRQRDEENAKEDSHTSKKLIGAKFDGRFPLSQWELAVAIGVVLLFLICHFCISVTMPAAEYGKIKFPRSISDLRVLKGLDQDWHKLCLLGNNLPSLSRSIKLIKNLKACSIKLYEPIPKILKELRKTNFEVALMVLNEVISNDSSNQTIADEWVKANLLPLLFQNQDSHLFQIHLS